MTDNFYANFPKSALDEFLRMSRAQREAADLSGDALISDCAASDDDTAGVVSSSGSTNWPLPEDAEHADAKAELWALLSAEQDADKWIETGIKAGNFVGNDYNCCAYGSVINQAEGVSWDVPDNFDYDQYNTLRFQAEGLRNSINQRDFEMYSPLEEFVYEAEKGDTDATNSALATVVRWIHEWQAPR